MSRPTPSIDEDFFAEGARLEAVRARCGLSQAPTLGGLGCLNAPKPAVRFRSRIRPTGGI